MAILKKEKTRIKLSNPKNKNVKDKRLFFLFQKQLVENKVEQIQKLIF